MPGSKLHGAQACKVGATTAKLSNLGPQLLDNRNKQFGAAHRAEHDSGYDNQVLAAAENQFSYSSVNKHLGLGHRGFLG